MTSRTIRFSAERSQVFQSLACLSSQLNAENVHISVRSHTAARRSVFLRFGPVQSQNSPQAPSVRRSGDGCGPAQKTVFDRLAGVTALQVDVPTVRHGAVNSNRTPRTVVKNKRLAELVSSTECVSEKLCNVEDMRIKLTRIRQAKEQQQTGPKQLSSMRQLKEQQQNVTDILSPKFDGQEKPSENSHIDNDVDMAKVPPVQAMFAEGQTGNAFVQTENDSNKLFTKTKPSSKADKTDDIKLYGTRIHWRAKMEKSHEKFRETQKLKLLQQRRTSLHQATHRADIQQPKRDVIRMTTDTRHHVRSDVILYSRKRQAPSIDALVTPAKRARRIG